MQEIITLTGKKYVEYIEPEKEYKRWRADHFDPYFIIDIDWSIQSYFEEWDKEDNFLYSIHNYFQTEKEAIKERDKRLAIFRVNDAILSLNEWWKEDWNNRWQEKWYIVYNLLYVNHNEKKLFESSYNLYTNEWTFLSGIKSREIAKQIIKEHQEDLKLIFDI